MSPTLSFGERLRRAREALGMNQRDLAELLGVSFEAVSKWERGVSTPAGITQEGALARLKERKAREDAKARKGRK